MAISVRIDKVNSLESIVKTVLNDQLLGHSSNGGREENSVIFHTLSNLGTARIRF